MAGKRYFPSPNVLLTTANGLQVFLRFAREWERDFGMTIANQCPDCFSAALGCPLRRCRLRRCGSQLSVRQLRRVPQGAPSPAGRAQRRARPCA